ncbi:hypothetical protein BLNAU_21924 [Blattamonas nauphoetae]|uniref:Uncharacterized protein n=1 Tax=Blattamonas nauphoetae TaxID=2049346 RepID=A0ABQ9WUK7_9EUKA|nr:hypothetical protein BLNAU_21924 [Blattamonas nauphoetae]
MYKCLHLQQNLPPEALEFLVEWDFRRERKCAQRRTGHERQTAAQQREGDLQIQRQLASTTVVAEGAAGQEHSAREKDCLATSVADFDSARIRTEGAGIAGASGCGHEACDHAGGSDQGANEE